AHSPDRVQDDGEAAPPVPVAGPAGLPRLITERFALPVAAPMGAATGIPRPDRQRDFAGASEPVDDAVEQGVRVLLPAGFRLHELRLVRIAHFVALDDAGGHVSIVHT